MDFLILLFILFALDRKYIQGFILVLAMFFYTPPYQSLYAFFDYLHKVIFHDVNYYIYILNIDMINILISVFLFLLYWFVSKPNRLKSLIGFFKKMKLRLDRYKSSVD